MAKLAPPPKTKSVLLGCDVTVALLDRLERVASEAERDERVAVTMATRRQVIFLANFGFPFFESVLLDLANVDLYVIIAWLFWGTKTLSFHKLL